MSVANGSGIVRSRIRAWHIVLTLAAVLALSLPASAIASASGAQAPRIPIRQSTSGNWSGYAVETSLTNPQTNAVTDVRGSWVIPTMTCTNKNQYSAAWVGIDGYSSGTVEQIGTEQDCIRGRPSYSSWYEMYPAASVTISGFAVKAGDLINAEVQYTSGTSFTLTLKNVNTSATFSTTKSASGASRQSAEWVMEAPSVGGNVLPLANFGTINFSGASATLLGSSHTISGFANDPITMQDGTARATPSALSTDGGAFSVTYSTTGRGGGHK